MEGFYCDNHDCVAKKREGSFCFSGSNEECECGKCIVDMENFYQICLGENKECDKEGKFFIILNDTKFWFLGF